MVRTQHLVTYSTVASPPKSIVHRASATRSQPKPIAIAFRRCRYTSQIRHPQYSRVHDSDACTSSPLEGFTNLFVFAHSTSERGLSCLHTPHIVSIRRLLLDVRPYFALNGTGSSPFATASPRASLGRRTRRSSRLRNDIRSSVTRQAACRLPERRLNIGGSIRFVRSQQCAVAC
jgi:hypothetical protein